MENTKILATVGTKEISNTDIDAVLKTLNPQQAMQFNSEQGRNQVLHEIINQELFYFEALDKGLTDDEAYKSEMEKIQSTFLKQYAINKLLSTITVTDEEIAKYYESNKEQFKKAESTRASHILVDTEESAKDIYEQIKSGSITFEDAAKTLSGCPSSSNGGDLGFFTRGKMVPEFEDAAFKLDVAEVSEPVKTQFGYHLIKVTDKSKEEISSLDEVKPNINNLLMSQKQQDLYFSKLDELKKVYPVKINE